MNDFKIKPEWFTSSKSKNAPLDLDKCFDDDVSQLSFKDQELIRLILSRHNKNIQKIISSSNLLASASVTYYSFSANIKIQSVSRGVMYFNFFPKYFLTYYNSESSHIYTVCEIDTETINALYPGKLKRFSKNLMMGMGMFLIYLICFAAARGCSKAMVKEVMAPNREDVINKLRKEVALSTTQDTGEISISFESIDKENGAIVNGFYKRIKKKDFSQMDFDLSEAQKRVNNYYCTNKGMDVFRKYNIPMTYKYYSADKVKLYELSSNNSNCKFQQ